MCTPLRHSTFLAVNVDRTRDLQIFSLTLSHLSYTRNVVGSNLGSRVAYIYLLTGLTVKEIELNSQYHAPKNIIL